MKTRKLKILGELYTKKKKLLKQEFKSRQIIWCGNLENYVWKSPDTTVTAQYDHNDEDVLLMAYVTLSGPPEVINPLCDYIILNFAAVEQKLPHAPPKPTITKLDDELIQAFNDMLEYRKRTGTTKYEY